MLTAGALVGQSRELLGILTASEDNRKTKVISAPVIIATDSIPASINVGQEVPTLASQAVTGVQSGGSSLFANTISNRSSGVTLNIVARVNPSGIVTMVINQEVSTPQAPAAERRHPVAVLFDAQRPDPGDGPGRGHHRHRRNHPGDRHLQQRRNPLAAPDPRDLGGAFGAKSTTKERTELVVFMTPRVIYDTNGMVEASDELKSKLKRLTKIIQE